MSSVKSQSYTHSGTDSFLSIFGLDRESSPVLLVLLGFSLLLFGGLYVFDGNIALVSALMYMTTVLLISAIKPVYSLYLLMATVMLFEQYAIPGFAPWTFEVRFFSNLKEVPYIPYFHTGFMNMAELHLFFLCSGLLLHASFLKDFKYKPISVPFPFLLFMASLVGFFGYGISRGGDFMVALWEVRALFYLCIMFIIVPQLLDTKKQLHTLFWIFIIGITFKALQGVSRFVGMGFSTGGFQVLTNHEDAVFMVTLFILLMVFISYKVNTKQRIFLLVMLLPILVGFLVAQRRATFGSLFVSVGAFIILLPMAKRLVFMHYFIPIMIGLIIYGAAFWNSSNPIGGPVQKFKSGIGQADKTENYRDYSSNLYRENENYNLAQTALNNPVLGVGFGNVYEQPIPLVNIAFPLMDYIPHNQIYWVIVKTGAVGFFIFWFFFNSFVAKSTKVFMRLEDPWLKAITAVITIAVINQMVVSFFDLQLTYSRNMFYLGCLMGMLPVIEKISREEEKEDNLTPPPGEDGQK